MIPAHTRTAAFHQARAAQYEAARADPDQRDIAGSNLAQVADGSLIYLRAGVEDPSNDHDIVEQLGLDEAARRLDEHTAARGHRALSACHDRPLHVQRPAAVAFVGREPQVVDEDRKRR